MCKLQPVTEALLAGQNFTFKWTINLLGNWECTDNVTPRHPVRSRNEPGQRPDLLLSILSLGCPRHVLTPQPGKTFKKILLVNPSDAVDLDKSLHHLGPQQPHQQSGTSWLFFFFFFKISLTIREVRRCRVEVEVVWNLLCPGAPPFEYFL